MITKEKRLVQINNRWEEQEIVVLNVPCIYVLLLLVLFAAAIAAVVTWLVYERTGFWPWTIT